MIKFCGFGFYLVILEFELRKQEECCGCVVVTWGYDWQKVHSLVELRERMPLPHFWDLNFETFARY